MTTLQIYTHNSHTQTHTHECMSSRDQRIGKKPTTTPVASITHRELSGTPTHGFPSSATEVTATPPRIPSYFMCPTGKGDNSSTLDRRVLDGCPVWGFTEGSAKRFRSHMRPGDVLIFGKPGTGLFDRVGVVNTKNPHPELLGDWLEIVLYLRRYSSINSIRSTVASKVLRTSQERYEPYESLCVI
jgi:hypothetical protein